MRVHTANGDKEVLAEFAEWLLRLGNGKEQVVEGTEDIIELDPQCIPPTEHGKIDVDGLLDWVFPNLAQRCADCSGAGPSRSTDDHASKVMDWLAERAILAPHNETVDELNEQMLDHFPGVAQTCDSSDVVVDDDAEDGTGVIPVEYLNSQKTSGMPEHALKIKPNMPLMLLRNLNPREGLCNGTRLLALALHGNGKLLAAKIITGEPEHRGRVVLLPRINLYPKEGVYPFKWCRRQFPVRAAFAMTVNKSQGQTLRRVGVYLKAECFAHGQLYVAAGHPDRIRFALLPNRRRARS